MSTIHAGALIVADRGVLVRGPAGSGKSSLMLGLMRKAPGFARLIGDDRVALTVGGGRLIAHAPAALEGLIEVRGLGIVRVPAYARGVIHLVVDREAGARLPESATVEIAGLTLPRLTVPPDDPAAVERTLFAIERLRW